MYDLTTLQNTPWLMEQGRLQAMAASLAKVQEWPTAGRIAKRAKKCAAGAMRKVSGKIAVLQIQGVIEQRMSMLGYLFGGFSTEYGEQALAQLLANKEVGAIILDIDSPGGTSYGVEEFADMVYDARAKKPIHALANAMMASAAYWIGCAATQCAVTPSGDVGSIGVYSLHVDYSEALAAEGIKVSVAKAGKYKTEFNPYETLNKEGQDRMQEMVDSVYTKFTKSVARARGVSPAEVRGARFGQGRVLCADEALANGLVDKVMTFSQLIEKLGGSSMPTQGPMSKTDVLRKRLAHDRAKTADLVPANQCGAHLSHDSVTSDGEPTWSDVDKAKLPRVAFAGKGEADKRSSWTFPHHHVTDGKLGDDGVYTDGTLWLNRGGLNAAWAAAQGARSGEKAPQDVIDHLQSHRKALGLDDDK